MVKTLGLSAILISILITASSILEYRDITEARYAELKNKQLYYGPDTEKEQPGSMEGFGEPMPYVTPDPPDPHTGEAVKT